MLISAVMSRVSSGELIASYQEHSALSTLQQLPQTPSHLPKFAET